MTYYCHSLLQHSNVSERVSGLARILALGLAYFLSAKLGLLLAVPPGYASPVFPASGIALAGILIMGYRCWPGVFAGSLMLNISVSADPTLQSSTLTTLLLANGFAAGAVLQAVTGAHLIRRYSAFPVPFSDWRKLVNFLFWGGPASCVISAIIGVTVLKVAGRIPGENFLYNSVTWWIGDTFGVLIFLPLILIWTLPSDRMKLSKRVTATVPAAIVFALVTFVVWYAISWERARIQHHFDRQATFLSLAFEKGLYGNLIAVTSLRSFVTTVDQFDQQEFHEFARGILDNHQGIQALSWNPSVRNEDRAAFEAEIRRAPIADFQITERDAAGQLQRAGERPEYVVVRFIEPYEGNETAMGFDIASDPTREEALALARESGSPATTGRIELVQERAQQFGVLVLAPVYEEVRRSVNATQDRRALKGYVVGVLRMSDVITSALDSLETDGIVFRLIDNTAPADERLLYEHASADDGVSILEEEALLGGSVALLHESHHNIGGRLWSFQLAPTQQYIASHRPEKAWMILSGVLLISSLVVAFTVVLVGRDEALSVLVKDLTSAKAEAIKANNAKSEFLAAMSHDLRTPLNAIMGFSDVMQKQIFGKLGNPRYESYVQDIHQSGTFLLNLINEVLDTSKIEAGRYRLDEQCVDISELIEGCVHMIRPMADQERIRLSSDIPDGLVRIRCDRMVVAQTFNNLLSNAVKFTRESGEVRITARMTSSGALIVGVFDTGIGMSSDEKIRALEPFGQARREHTKLGTGLGLYLCARFMGLHGGDLDFHSKKGRGTTVLISFPPERAIQST